MAGLKSGYRARLFKAVHAEAAKRQLDHDALHDLCVSRFNVHSMGEVTDAQLLFLYREWTGKTLKTRAEKPRRGTAGEDRLRMVSGEELVALSQEFATAQMGIESQAAFVRRQLRGRDQIRTRGDFARVYNGLHAMNRRNGR